MSGSLGKYIFAGRACYKWSNRSPKTPDTPTPVFSVETLLSHTVCASLASLSCTCALASPVKPTSFSVQQAMHLTTSLWPVSLTHWHTLLPVGPYSGSPGLLVSVTVVCRPLATPAPTRAWYSSARSVMAARLWLAARWPLAAVVLGTHLLATGLDVLGEGFH